MAKILVVEDECVTTQSVWQWLENSEHILVSNVASGLEAVQAAVDVQPDLILINIDRHSQPDDVKAAAQIYQTFRIPTIFLSANTADELLQPAIATGLFGYLIKPIHSLELQVAISSALQRARLEKQLEQTKQHNLHLRRQILERTAQLQQALDFEALLKRITDRVRDSLDENQILQAAVEELGHELGIQYCGAALYDADLTIATITYEYSTSDLRARGRVFAIAEEPASEVYYQLFRNQHCQFCLAVPNPERPIEEHQAILACPLLDDQGVLGDLWLFKSKEQAFGAIEIRLVQQVANQCAIALRQSRLYQAAQAQVIELERLNQLKDDFLSTISHELRTPISNIKMAIQMLEIALQPLGVLDTKFGSASRYFQILQTECQREIGLINDLLSLSYFNSATAPLTLSTIDLQPWLSGTIEPFLSRIHAQQQQLELDIPSALPPLTTDLSCLERILSELLSNACKYTPPQETIRIGVRATVSTTHTDTTTCSPSLLLAPQPALEISVTNTGIEIPAPELSRIFDHFYRVPTQDPWRYSGAGMGLALTKKLVSHLGASIHVTSAIGQTTFTVTLPLGD